MDNLLKFSLYFWMLPNTIQNCCKTINNSYFIVLWVKELHGRKRARIFETINYFIELKNQNLPIKESLSKYLKNGIFELRTSLAK